MARSAADKRRPPKASPRRRLRRKPYGARESELPLVDSSQSQYTSDAHEIQAHMPKLPCGDNTGPQAAHRARAHSCSRDRAHKINRRRRSHSAQPRDDTRPAQHVQLLYTQFMHIWLDARRDRMARIPRRKRRPKFHAPAPLTITKRESELTLCNNSPPQYKGTSLPHKQKCAGKCSQLPSE